MTDDLIARLRVQHGNKHALEAADALESQAEEIQNLENRLRVALDAVKEDTARIAELEAVQLRIGQPGKKIVYCRDGHEEAVLLARAALGEKDADTMSDAEWEQISQLSSKV